jgi:hypothetical protein
MFVGRGQCDGVMPTFYHGAGGCICAAYSVVFAYSRWPCVMGWGDSCT